MKPRNFSPPYCPCTRPHRTLNQPLVMNVAKARRQAVFLKQHHLAGLRTFARYLRHRVHSQARTWLCTCRLSANASRRTTSLRMDASCNSAPPMLAIISTACSFVSCVLSLINLHALAVILFGGERCTGRARLQVRKCVPDLMFLTLLSLFTHTIWDDDISFFQQLV